MLCFSGFEVYPRWVPLSLVTTFFTGEQSRRLF